MSAAPRRLAHSLLAAAAGIAAVLIAVPAHASLGALRGSVDADRVRLRAHLKSTASGSYTVHELTQDGGAVTREYTNAAGTVFAVRWEGPARPDLKQLFGDYFNRFQADTRPVGRIRMRRALAAHDLDFIVNTGGHPGAMWGYAVLPGAVPQGFSLETLR